MKFSEWTKRADAKVLDTAAGDNYEKLPQTAKDCIDSAVERFIKFSKARVMPSLPNDRKKHMRKQATTIFELTKGFTGEPIDNAMKAALEMAGYVQELTTDVE